MKKLLRQNNMVKSDNPNIKFSNIIYLIFLLFLLIPMLSFAEDEYLKVNTGELDLNYSKKILVINSYHQGHPWTDGITKSILDTFNDRDVNTEIHFEYIDSKRIVNSAFWGEILKDKLSAYDKGYLDLIIVSDENALKTLYEIGHSYHQVPIVYCGISANINEYPDSCPMIVGIEEYLPFKENVELGLKLFPKTKHIAVVTDNSMAGKSHRDIAKNALKGIDIIWLDGSMGMNTQELNARLKNLPENTIVLFSSWQIDGDGRFWDPIKYYPIIAKHSNSPIFSVTDVGVNNAFLGGLVSVSAIQGKLAAELGIQILFGELLENIARVKDQNAFYFNWQELNRWDVNIRDLPSGAIIVNKPETVYDQYKTYFLLTLALIILLFILFWMLLIYHFRYRNFEIQRTEMALKTKRLANRYNILFEQSNSAIVIFELETGVVVTFNEKALKIFNTPQEHFKNYPLKKYFSNYDELKKNIKKLSTAPFEMEMFRWDRSTFHAQVILNILIEDNSQYVYAIINDITIKKEQENELKVSKDRLNEALLNSKNSYWEWDLVNNILLKDDNFWLALDVDPKKLKENPNESSYYLNSVHPDDLDGFIDSVNKAVEGEQDTILHELRMSLFGNITWVEVRGVIAMRDENGKGLMINGFMMNINERKKQEEELVKAKNRAEESDRLKSAFISNISHEIRTPLNGIVGFSNLLGRENLKLEDKRKYLSFINENNDLLLKLINDILEISKIETDSLSINLVSCNLLTLCDNILAQERVSLSPTVTLSLAEVPNINIQVDKINLAQVIRNLLSNAKKFTSEGNIELGYRIIRDKLEFYISDTGIGIPQDMIEKVFERFIQVDPFSSGTGLGLSISKAIIEKMGGKIWLESVPEKGTTAFFTLQYKKALIEINEIEPIKTDPHEVHESKKKTSILIAEDDESNFILLNVVLTGKYQVIRAHKEDDILSHLSQYNPRILIADLDMPGFTDETIEAIRKSHKGIPIIGITDNTLDFVRNKEIISILDGHVTKPINIKNLLEILETQLENK
ncbi:MAG: PAS domain S-box protein [Candidatus Marinimicrobia bacterium]|nr:PAS domain S-box protein [Candidatus Neomarinimicrobiota bacterium]